MNETWIVYNGETCPLSEFREDGDGLAHPEGLRLWRDDYGKEWIAVEAKDGHDAVTQADQWDGNSHPELIEMTLFMAGYLSSVFNLKDGG